MAFEGFQGGMPNYWCPYPIYIHPYSGIKRNIMLLFHVHINICEFIMLLFHIHNNVCAFSIIRNK